MLLNASGCLDALTAPDGRAPLDGFVTKTITPLPREGNAPARIAETEHGMLNAIGLANPGRERFLAETLPRAARARRAALGLGRRLLGRGLRRDVRRASTASTAIELNLSCPNVDEAADSAAEIVAACRAATALPALREALAGRIRTSPRSRARSRRPARTASRCQHAARRSRSTGRLRPVLARGERRLSGPALKPVALHAVHACRRATGLPIVGMGGVQSGRDALELIACGARHVALGTVLFSDPDAPARVRAELADAAADAGFAATSTTRSASALDPEKRLENRKKLLA